MVEFTSEMLIAKFERDINSGVQNHVFMSVRHSLAAHELFAGGRKHLAAIAAHLRNKKPDEYSIDLRTGWCLLLSNISEEIDCRVCPPITLCQIEWWADWAKKESVWTGVKTSSI